MSKNNKKWKVWKWLKWLLYVLPLVALFAWLGWATAMEYAYSFSEEKSNIIHINSEEDMDLAGAFYNDVCYLETDLEIGSFDTLTKPDRPFIGTFDGMGHTLTLGEEAHGALFGYIGEGGVVRNLNIVLNCTVSSSYFGLLAYENKGTIEDCKISGEITIPVGAVASIVTAVNRGVIRHVVIENVTVKGASSEEAAASVYGGLCAYNYGTLENIVSSSVSFEHIDETVRENVFEHGMKNYGVGSIIGVNMGGTASGLVETVASQYLSDADTENVVYTDDITTKLTTEYVAETLGFELITTWKFTDKHLELVVLGGNK